MSIFLFFRFTTGLLSDILSNVASGLTVDSSVEPPADKRNFLGLTRFSGCRGLARVPILRDFLSVGGDQSESCHHLSSFFSALVEEFSRRPRSEVDIDLLRGQ